MIQIRETPGPQLRAQLVGLGYGSVIPALRNVGPIPPIIQKVIQDAAAAGPSTGGGSGASDTGGTPNGLVPAAPPAETNWLLWGGVGVGVLLLGLLIIRR